MDLKEYVNSNIDIKKLDFFEKSRLTRFNKYVDSINAVYEDNNIYSYFINYYMNIGKLGIDLIIILICLISYDTKILNQNIEIIDDIVTFLYEDKIQFHYYEKYLHVCLLNIVTNWLGVFHALKNTRQANIEPNIILTIIFRILIIDKKDQYLEKDIDELMEKFYDIFDPLKKEKWFNEHSSIDDIYNVIKCKMDYIQNMMNYIDLNFFVDEFESLEKMKDIKKLDVCIVNKYKNYVLTVDSLEVSDALKIINILSIVKDFLKEYSNSGISKVISFEEMKKKYENR